MSYNYLDLPSWNKNSTPWNHPSLGQFYLPGTGTINNIKRGLKIEDNNASGNDGGGAIIKGLPQPEFTIELRIVSGTDERKWKALIPVLINVNNPKDRPVFPVTHPALADYGIYYCIVKEYSQSQPQAGGPLLVSIICQSIIPAKPGATKIATAKKAQRKSATKSSPPSINVNQKEPVGPQLHPEAQKILNPNKQAEEVGGSSTGTW